MNQLLSAGEAPSAIMRRQVDRGLGIPRELYTSQELYEREISGIFHRSWLLVGHESQLGEPGDYLTVDFGEESIIVARTQDGSLAAFHNVCRHRGARITDAGCGKARRLVCPYHRWTYGIDGKLTGVPKMPDDFDLTEYSLTPVSVAAWHGLVLINLAQDPGVPISEMLRFSEEVIGPFALENARVAHTIDYDVAANWKVVWENAQECYHCRGNHPEFCKSVDVSPLGSEEYDESQVRRSGDRLAQCAIFPHKANAISLTMNGRPASSRPMGEFTTGIEPYTAAMHLKPSFAAVCCADYAVLLAEQPVAVDRTRVRMTWLVDRDAQDGRDFELDNLTAVWDATNRQDWELCARTQRGIRSRCYEPGPLSLEEAGVGGFHSAYAHLLAAAGL